MIRIITKAEQYHSSVFGGRLVANKPVAFRTKSSVSPYSNLFYWSHGIATEDCEFGLHPHEGFEIMTFVLEGQVSHYDTETKVWTPLVTGDFQIIQSGSGIQHQEKISKGTRGFQIWFDPGFENSIRSKPDYRDYHRDDFKLESFCGIPAITYIGHPSETHVQTPQLSIRKLILSEPRLYTMALDPSFTYTIYVLSGCYRVNQTMIVMNDVIRAYDSLSIELTCQQAGECFMIQSPTQPNYGVIWERT
jgi:redox-sensitive bicupin YhaK (pirin superfamily)